MKEKTYIIINPAEKWITELSPNTIRLRSKELFNQKQKVKFEILLCDPEFLQKINTIRKTFNIPTNGFADEKKALKWAKNLYSKEYRLMSLKNTIRDLYPEKIGSRWYLAIEYYLLFNRTNADHLLPNQVNYWVEIDDDEYRLKIEIYKDTSIEDIKKIWPEIKKQRKLIGTIKKMKVKERENSISNKNIVYTINEDKIIKINLWDQKRFGNYKNFLQYRKAYELRKIGKKYTEIAVKLGWSNADSYKVGTYIKRFKQAIKENILF